jgi:hypothetical protein
MANPVDVMYSVGVFPKCIPAEGRGCSLATVRWLELLSRKL